MISIGFSKARSKLAVASKLICLIEKTEYSHVFIELDKVIIHANHVGVAVVYKPLFLEKNIVTNSYELFLGTDQINHLKDSIIPYLGRKYGIVQLIGILLSLVLKCNKNFFTKGYICSEFVTLVLEDIFYIKINKDINLVTPKDIQEALDGSIK